MDEADTHSKVGMVHDVVRSNKKTMDSRLLQIKIFEMDLMLIHHHRSRT